MDKIITVVVMLFSFVVWFSTDGNARAISRSRRPEIKAALAAETSAKQAQEAAEAQAKEAGAQKQRDTLLPSFGVRSGIMGTVDNGKDLRFAFSGKMVRNDPADVDPNGWKAFVTIFNMAQLNEFETYWAVPQIDGNSIKLQLKEADKRELFNGASDQGPGRNFNDITFKLENGAWTGETKDGYGLTWKINTTAMDKTVADSFTGMWEGKLGEGKIDFSLANEGGELAGPITYHGMYTCKSRVRALPFGQDSFLLVIGSLPGATNCPNNVGMKITNQGDKLTAAAYDRGSESASILSFTKK